MILLNDPYHGGITHLNDHLLLYPVFYNDEIIAWTANIAHWADIGGHSPGSINLYATEVFDEGIIIPGVFLF